MSNLKEALLELGVAHKKEKKSKEKKKNSNTALESNLSLNIGWLFYKDYYRDIDFEILDKKENKLSFEEKSKSLIAKKLKKLKNTQLPNTHSFELTTTYPGLLIGSGHTHETSSEGEFKIGFEFDYTTGLPIIRGSSVKGVLRSAFKHPEYIKKDILKRDDIDIKELEESIFNNSDIFFDAEIIKANEDGEFLGEDYITPHEKPLKNPIPIKFLNVLPNVVFEFKFKLKDGLIKADEKEKLFKAILLDLGVGAKTNVGYGQFDELK